MKTYQDLIVWQKSMSMAEAVYRILPLFPKEELYGIVSQLRRAGVSIPANIAEGYGRNSTGDYLKHLRYAQGSLFEVQTLLELSCRVELVEESKVHPIQEQSREIERMLSSLMRAIGARART